MSQYKRILNVEKKYEQKILLAQRKQEKELDKVRKEIALEEEVTKEDYRKELNRKLMKEKKELNAHGELTLSHAQGQAREIRESSKQNQVEQLIMEAIKNV